MALKLFSYPSNPNAYKALIAAEYAGASVEVPPFQMGVTNKTEDFLKMNPMGKIPVLLSPSGPIFESNAIARYIARLSDSGLYGSSAYEAASVDQWVDFASNEVAGNVMSWAGPLYGFSPRAPEAEAKAKEKVDRAMAALNSVLASRTYLVGESVTLADIVVACSLYYGFLALFSPKYMEAYPHVNRYFFTLAHKAQFKKVIGDVKQCAETPTDTVPLEKNPWAAMLQRRAAGGAAPSTAAKEAAPATPPQDEAPAATVPGTDPRTAGLTDEGEAPKPKAKNPLDLLPPSPMVMDNWKRLYSNTKAKDFKEVAIKGFWEMYDAEGYSLWFCQYKHNEENTVKFITLNKVSGFLQRMDLVRKYAFGKMCILGADPGPYTIRGVWLFRGPEVPQYVMDEVYDMELYDWTKADISDEAQKALVSDMFEEPDEIEGVPLVEAKCFK